MRMQRLFLLTAAVMLTALCAMASDGPEGGQLKPTAVRSMVMGPTVRNAPYSGEEITTSDHVLGDGTRIHNEGRTKVYRDSEGRVRRDTAEHIQILDPVAGVSYMLDPKAMTAMKFSFYMTTTTSNADGPISFKTKARSGGEGSSSASAGAISISKAEGIDMPRMAGEAGVVVADGSGPETAFAETMDAMKVQKIQLAQITEGQFGNVFYSSGFAVGKTAAGKKEQLETQMIEGVLAEGTRTTNTLAVGAIGNDREINIVAERWYSPDLKTVLVSEHSDPRSGKESFRLTGVSRNEPDPALFQLPAGYRLVENKRPNE